MRCDPAVDIQPAVGVGPVVGDVVARVRLDPVEAPRVGGHQLRVGVDLDGDLAGAVASTGTRTESAAVLDKFAAIQMLDVHFPTTDGRTLILSRYTHQEPDHKILLEQLNLTLPAQPPPRISSRGKLLNQN